MRVGGEREDVISWGDDIQRAGVGYMYRVYIQTYIHAVLGGAVYMFTRKMDRMSKIGRGEAIDVQHSARHPRSQSPHDCQSR
jgi:hypothetical protein